MVDRYITNLVLAGNVQTVNKLYSLKDDNFRKELDELIYNIKDGEKICGNTVKNG